MSLRFGDQFHISCCILVGIKVTYPGRLMNKNKVDLVFFM